MGDAYWIWCDLDGNGRCWRLAVERGKEVYFPLDDFGEDMTIEEYREEFPDSPMVAIMPPVDIDLMDGYE